MRGEDSIYTPTYMIVTMVKTRRSHLTRVSTGQTPVLSVDTLTTVRL